MTNDTESPYKISTDELVKILMQQFDIHEGNYLLVPELTANIGPHKIPLPDGGDSGPHIGVSVVTTAYSLVKAPDSFTDGFWDAAVVNPK